MAFLILSLLPVSAGYSFEITATPTQCGPLSLRIIHGSGKPPYVALVVPFGPFPGPTEQRNIFQQQFTGADVNLTLPYPGSSDFVIMVHLWSCHIGLAETKHIFGQVSDSDGIGTGGTSVPITVSSSSNSSCLVAATPPAFIFQIIPNNVVNQCQTTTLAWDKNNQGWV